MRAIVVAFLFFAAAHNDAVAQHTARSAYQSGQFLLAADTAERTQDPCERALAARALLAEAATTDNPARIDALVNRAINNAKAALHSDPESVEARLQLALAYGFRGRRLSVMEAMREGLAHRGKRLLIEAQARAPHEAWTYALIGGWHFEVLRRGGRTGAAMFGADLGAGAAAFENARALSPHDPVIAYQYAVALLELDPKRHTAQARALLLTASNLPARDAFEARMVQEARRVVAVLDSSGPHAAAAAAAARFS
jgi:hypothetical protein